MTRRKRPALFLTDSELAAVKAKIKNHEWARKIFARIRRNARIRTDDRMDLRAAHNAAIVYALTGEKPYAEKAKRVLLHMNPEVFLDARYRELMGYRGRLRGRLNTRVVGETLPFIVMAYEFIWDRLTPAEREKIEKDLFRPAVEAVAKHDRGDSNWQAQHNVGTAAVGFLLDDKDLIRQAIDHPKTGFKHHIAHALRHDGLWWEGSAGYHAYTMEACAMLAEMARHRGIDLYHFEANGNSLKKMFDVLFEVAGPDLELPANNDTWAGNLRSFARYYELAYARYGDKKYAWLLGKAKRTSLETLLYGKPKLAGARPKGRSLHLPESGWAMLKSAEPEKYFSSRGFCLLLDYGPHGDWHGHHDKLSIELFAFGSRLLVDPGSPTGYDTLCQEWFTRTLAHNTVTVGCKTQQGAGGKWRYGNDDARRELGKGGKLLMFEDSPGLKIAEATADMVYPGVEYRRLVAMTDLYVIDIFRTHSRSEWTYDWALHGAEGFTLATSLAAKPGQPAAFAKGAYKYLADVKRATAAKQWTATWQPTGKGAPKVEVTMLGEAGTEVYTASCPIGRNDARGPMLMVRRKCRETAFVSVIIPFRGECPVTSVRRLGGAGRAVGIEVRTDTFTDVFLSAENEGRVESVGEFEFDGRAAFIRRDSKGKLLRVHLQGGSVLSQNGKTLLKAEALPGRASTTGAAPQQRNLARAQPSIAPSK